jgi:hypothetical protein
LKGIRIDYDDETSTVTESDDEYYDNKNTGTFAYNPREKSSVENKLDKQREEFYKNLQVNTVGKEQFKAKYETAKTSYEESIARYLSARKDFGSVVKDLDGNVVDITNNVDKIAAAQKEYETRKAEWYDVRGLAYKWEKIRTHTVGIIKNEKELELSLLYEKTNIYFTVKPHLRRIVDRYQRIQRARDDIIKIKDKIIKEKEKILNNVDIEAAGKIERDSILLAFQANIDLTTATTAVTDIDVATKTITDLTWFKMIDISEELKDVENKSIFGNGKIDLIGAIDKIKSEVETLLDSIKTDENEISGTLAEITGKKMEIKFRKTRESLEKLGSIPMDIGKSITEERLNYIISQIKIIFGDGIDNCEDKNINNLLNNVLLVRNGALYKANEGYDKTKISFNIIDEIAKKYGDNYLKFKSNDVDKTIFKTDLKNAAENEQTAILNSFNTTVEGKVIEMAYRNIKHAKIAIDTAIATYNTESFKNYVECAANMLKLAEMANEKAKTLFNYKEGSQHYTNKIAKYLLRLRAFELARIIETIGVKVETNYLIPDSMKQYGISIIAVESIVLSIIVPTVGVTYFALFKPSKVLSQFVEDFIKKYKENREENKRLSDDCKKELKVLADKILTEEEELKTETVETEKDKIIGQLEKDYTEYEKMQIKLEELYKKIYYYNNFKGIFGKLLKYTGELISYVDPFKALSKAIKTIPAVTDYIKKSAQLAIEKTGNAIIDDRLKTIEKQLKAAEDAEKVAKEAASKLTDNVKNITDADSEPNKEELLNKINDEIKYAESQPVASLAMTATNAATTADVASRDVYYAVNFVNKVSKEPKQITIDNGTPIQLGYVNGKNVIIDRAQNAAKNAKTAAATARNQVAIAANKTRKLRQLALSKGLRATKGAIISGVGSAATKTRDAITYSSELAKRKIDGSVEAQCQKIETLTKSLNGMNQKIGEFMINSVKTDQQLLDEKYKKLTESPTLTMTEKKKLINEIAEKERNLIALSARITAIETAARAIYLQIQAAKRICATKSPAFADNVTGPIAPAPAPAPAPADNATGPIVNATGGSSKSKRKFIGGTDNDDATTAFNEIKKKAKEAREASRAASVVSVKARAIGLKSRGESVVSFLKTAEQKYKNSINKQEQKIKGLKKIEPKMGKTRSPDFEITSKVFPLPFVNSKGFRIGDYKVYVNTDMLPFSGTDQANHFLLNLFDYVNYEGTPVDPKNKRDISDFFKSTNHKFDAFTPIKYPDESQTAFLEQQQEENAKEYKRLRERSRLFMNELAEMGKAGDPVQRAQYKTEIDKILKGIDDDSTITTDEEKVKKKQVVLSEYLNAIDELENKVKGDFKPLFQESFPTDETGKSFINAKKGMGGSRTRRKRKGKGKGKRKGKRRNKTLRKVYKGKK